MQAVDSGEAALAQVVDSPPDVVLMDVRLPGIDGYEASRQLRRLPGGTKLRIIVVTASGVTTDEIRQQAIDAGVDDYIAKPYNIAEFLHKIQHLCNLTYVYSHAVSQPAASDPPPRPGSAMAEGLPGALREALQEAIELGDMTQFEHLLVDVAQIDTGLKEHLGQLSLRFAYTELLELLASLPAASDSPGHPSLHSAS